MDRPKDLPNRLECSYCKRSHRHGGECPEKDVNKNETGCLFFQMDEKGCIRNADQNIPFSLYSIIPPSRHVERWMGIIQSRYKDKNK